MKITVILGSTRPNRKGERVAKWFLSQLKSSDHISYELMDLKNYPLPFYNEVESPDNLNGNYTNEVAKKWATIVNASDGFILITPEYNHGVSAVIKNALDYVYNEWKNKPISFVSYSNGLGAGIRAVEQLRLITNTLQMAPLQYAIHLPRVQELIDENGVATNNAINNGVAKLQNQIEWWATTLKNGRNIQAD